MVRAAAAEAPSLSPPNECLRAGGGKGKGGGGKGGGGGGGSGKGEYYKVRDLLRGCNH